MTKASKKKSSGSKYAVLILTAVIAIVARLPAVNLIKAVMKQKVFDIFGGQEGQALSLIITA